MTKNYIRNDKKVQVIIILKITDLSLFSTLKIFQTFPVHVQLLAMNIGCHQEKVQCRLQNLLS